MGFRIIRCCNSCGHVTVYRLSGTHYECMNKAVNQYGICDRYQPNISPTAIMRVIDEKLKELEACKDGEFKLTVRPPFHQNYHIQTREEMRRQK